MTLQFGLYAGKECAIIDKFSSHLFVYLIYVLIFSLMNGNVNRVIKSQQAQKADEPLILWYFDCIFLSSIEMTVLV